MPFRMRVPVHEPTVRYSCSMDQKHGYFVISLDFELFWGMFDKYMLAEYGPRILGEQQSIPRMLKVFKKYGIHATWATVGMLMARNKKELFSLLPSSQLQPTYEDMRVSAYTYLKTANIGEDEKTDPYHFGSSLVEKIKVTPHQEIANHTFSHYYCVDGKENRPEIFATDLRAHTKISETYNLTTTSIVFPRNQMNEEALRVCHTAGLTAYRGNEYHFLYKPRKEHEQKLWIRMLRLADHYVNISGQNTYPLPQKDASGLYNIPASRFLRPFMKSLAWLEPFRMRRIKNAMTYAAKNREVFHLWWHPHNFGINQEQNFKNLEAILAHYAYLQSTYGFLSASMRDITNIASAR